MRAVDRSQDLLLGQLDERTVGAPLHLRIRPRVLFPFLAVLVPSFRGCLPCGAPGLQLRDLELFSDLPGAHLERGQAGESPFDIRIADSFGMELFVDVSIDAHRTNAFDVAWPGAESKTVEDVADGLVVSRDPGRRRRPGQH